MPGVPFSQLHESLREGSSRPAPLCLWVMSRVALVSWNLVTGC
jgi:hypothetical protein